MSHLRVPSTIQALVSPLGFVLLLTSLATSTAISEPVQVFDQAWGGVLRVELVSTLPEFSAMEDMAVEVDIYGAVTIAPGFMEYGGSVDLDGGCVYTREGSWQLEPFATYVPLPPERIEINENIFFQEHITMICPPPVGTAIDESPQGTFDGGLVFFWDEVVVGDAVIHVENDQGDSITWTLGLVPSLPNATSSWSAIKARYAP